MNTRFITLIVVALAIIAILIWWFTRATPTNQNTNQTTNQTIVNTTTNTSNVNEDRSFNTGNTNSVTINTNTPVANTNTNPATLTMTISANGVSPNSPTITRGTVVTFRNTDTIEHQIGSNPHPDHTDYPEFDLEIPAGASRQFTFTRIGSWGYHDHEQDLNTKYQGTITVQ